MEQLKKIIALRAKLHQHANLSLNEAETAGILKEFLRENTDLEIVDRGAWFYAAHREAGAGQNIAFRCDTDGIPNEDGTPYHGCGHDGHMATLCGLALEISGKKFGKNIFLLFQPAEETGQGGLICKDFVGDEKIDEIYGFHNTPGFKENRLLLRDRAYACASKGMTASLHGRQSHAGYPEHGINPAFLIADVITKLGDFLDAGKYESMVLATIVCVKVGERNFGVSPGTGELSLTIRAHYERDLDKLQRSLEAYISEKAEAAGMDCAFSYADVFPDTVNDSELYQKIKAMLDAKGYDYEILPEPFRWSEDFGYYPRQTKGFYFGVGEGEDWTPAHTKDFDFNDRLIAPVVRLFLDVISL